MKTMGEARVALWTGAAGNLVTVETSLVRLGCTVKRVSTFEDLWRWMEYGLDLLVVNCQNAPEVLFWMNGVRHAGQATPPVLTLATALDVEEYLRAMAMGAFDCVALPVQEKELHRLVSRAIEHQQVEPLLLHN